MTAISNMEIVPGSQSQELCVQRVVVERDVLDTISEALPPDRPQAG